MTFRDDFTRSAWLMVLLLGLAHPAFAQLTLDAFSPAYGATGVATTATVEFIFSAAVDTTVSFAEDDDPTFADFFLNLSMYPNPGHPLDVRVSGDGRLETVGRGENHPRADNGTPEGRAENRRVELHQR